MITAGEMIKNGGLVAFPTETVYGLGADAFNPQAVERIYTAKGRPGDNPLILHVASPAVFFELAQNPPPYAAKLIEAFWPGALTLVVKKNANLPHWLGGHPSRQTDTIAIRMPANPVAQAIIASSGCVIAAPSANKAGTPSPTTANHVKDDFVSGEVDMIVDGGSVALGLESTVIDATSAEPAILRPGAVTGEMINATLGIDIFTVATAFSATNRDKASTSHGNDSAPCAPPRSPGMKYRHYAPKAPMTIIVGASENIAAYIKKECKTSDWQSVGILASSDFLYDFATGEKAKVLALGGTPKAAAQNLFAHLRTFDKLGVSEIYAEAIHGTGLGVAIMDRMLKAAEGRIIYV